MPQLVSDELIELRLPSSTPNDPAIVKLQPLNAGEMAQLESFSDGQVDNTEFVWDIMARCIKEWNFVNKEGKVEPITNKSVRRLKPADFTAIIQEMNFSGTLSIEEEKKTNSISQRPRKPASSN
jgi:hypothetical protein